MRNSYSDDFRFILDSLTNSLHSRYVLGDENFRQLVKANKKLIDKSKRNDWTRNIIQAKAALILGAQKLTEGLSIEVEREIPDEREDLVADLYCTNPNYSEAIEIETGMVPSQLILERKITEDDAQLARTIGKIVRYSYNGQAKHFALALTKTPATNLDLIMPILSYFHEDYRKRDSRKSHLDFLESKASMIYSDPGLSRYQFEHAHLDRFYSIDTSKLTVERVPL